MGNTMGGGGSSRAAKVMKINGEVFKLKTPSRVVDVIKDYPNHVLLDSDDFLRFNLRANPLDPLDELKPKKIYLLVELPQFPGPLRRVKSDVRVAKIDPLIKRSISDLTILTKSTVGTGGMDCDDESPVGSTRVKMRLRKAEVEKIVKEGGDEDEIAERIVKLCLEDPAAEIGGGSVAPVAAEERGSNVGEDEVVERFNGRATCIPYVSYGRKYGRLTV